MQVTEVNGIVISVEKNRQGTVNIKKVEKAKCSHRTWRADFLVSKILEAGVLGLQLQVEELVKSWPISKLEEKILRFERLVQASTRLQSENQIDSMDF